MVTPAEERPQQPATDARAAERIDAARILELLDQTGGRRQGHFLLSSGLHSSSYVQCALLLENPAVAREIGAALARRLAPWKPESVLSPALGGLIIGHEVAAALGVPFRFAERAGPELVLRRGFTLRPGERVAIVEDVVTTGKSSLETADLAAAYGAQPVALGAILDRRPVVVGLTVTAKGSVPSGAVLSWRGQPLPVLPIATLSLPTYEPAACPLCAAGGEPEKPGSRPPAR